MKNLGRTLENTVFNPTLLVVMDFYGIPEYRF